MINCSNQICTKYSEICFSSIFHHYYLTNMLPGWKSSASFFIFPQFPIPRNSTFPVSVELHLKKKSTVQCIISSSKPLTCPLTSIFSSFVHRAIFLMFTNVHRVHWLFTHLPKNILQTSHLGIQHITKPNIKTKAKTNNSNNKKLFQPYCLHGSYISGPFLLSKCLGKGQPHQNHLWG